MRIAIIEDEQPNYDRLKRMLEAQEIDGTIDGPLISVVEVKRYLAQGVAPDLIFADIRLSDGLVFEAFNEVQTAIPVIFTTAYDEYALRAFKYNSLDYLLKPIDVQALKQALDRFRRGMRPEETEPLSRLETVGTAPYRRRFLCPDRDGHRLVKVDEVSHIALEEGVVRLFLPDGKCYPIDFSMDELETQLDPEDFFRANRQYIVHLDFIQGLTNHWSRKTLVRLQHFPQTEVWVSKERSSALKRWINR